LKKHVTILFLFFSLTANAQQKEETIQRGNDYYRQQQFDKAEAEYRKVVDAQPDDHTARMNLANSLQKQGKSDEAIKLYDEVAGNTTDAAIKSKAYYNKGAVLSKQKKLEESIEAYKAALRLNPNDTQARENLQKALLELKKKNPPKQKEQKKKEQQKPQPQPRISRKEAEQRLKLLEQKEKEVQQRLQKEKNKGGGVQTKDW
jgi:Ca-activated chloride channel homolog